MTDTAASQPTPAGDPRFHTTRWSVVLAAGTSGSAQARSALDQLVRSYWYPLYAFLRRRGVEGERAQDLTQGFFTRLLEREDLAGLAPEQGRFRAYLLAGVKNFLANDAEREQALKRGGGVQTFSIDAAQADRMWAAEPLDELTPERQFERAWAHSVLERTHARLAELSLSKGQQRLHESLLPHLTGAVELRSYREIAEELDSTEGAVKVAAHRLRRDFGRLLREEIAQTVSDPAEVDDEVSHLIACLGDG